jgi:very-short-patch-repair endonuclease
LSARVWRLVRDQHGVIARWQLLELGMHPQAIKHRLGNGRLHQVRRGVYAVGRPELTQLGECMAAVLACGPEALLSHDSAAALWAIRPNQGGVIDVSLRAAVVRRGPGLRVHRRPSLPSKDITTHHGIPCTSPIRTLLDLATVLPAKQLERAVNEADKLELVDSDVLRKELDRRRGQSGVAKLRKLLDRHTFRLTDSELERYFLPIARRAGLPPPLTQQWVNGFRVDFFWPDLGLVVETDGLRYHRTPAQQAADRRRDQVHTAAGLTPLRFTHYQVRYEAARVIQTLVAVANRLPPGATP